MTTSEKVRYIARFVVSISNIMTLVLAALFPALALFVYVNGFFFLQGPNDYSTLLKMCEFFINLTLLIVYTLLAVIFIRSMWTKTEAAYDIKFFRTLAKTSMWCCILNIIAFGFVIYLFFKSQNLATIESKALKDLFVFMTLYSILIGLGMAMTINSLQFFWRPSVVKTWVFNAQPLLALIVFWGIAGPSLVIELLTLLYKR